MTIGGNPFAARLETDGAAYRYFPVASIEGSEALPYALKVLLENVLRKAEDPESARELARRIVEAGLAGTVGDEVEFCSRTSRACRCSWTSRSCARPAWRWEEIPRRSTRRSRAIW